MIKTIQFKGQTFYDLAVQYMGNVEGAPTISHLNKLSLTADLQVGTKIIIPDSPINKDIVQEFKNKILISGENLTT